MDPTPFYDDYVSRDPIVVLGFEVRGLGVKLSHASGRF